MRHSKLRTALHSSNSMVFDMRPYQNIGEPVGDPHGGAAYGEKNSKFFKKALSIGLAVAGVALAIPTGGASLATMSLLQGLSLAGAALNLVGTVTGNGTLSKIGAFASLGAGLATAYSGKSALWNSLSTDTNTTGLSAQANEASKFMQADPLKNAVDAVSSGAESLTDVAASTSGIGNVSMMQNSNLAGNALSNANDVGSAIGSGSSLTSNPLTASYTSQAAGGASSLIPQANLADSVAQNVGNVATESLSAADNFGIAKTNMGATSSALPDITANATNTGLLGMAKGAGTGVLSFIKDNPVATKLVGDFIQGAYQSPQDKAKAQAYIDYYNQQTDVSKQQQINANAIPTMNLSINPAAPVQFNTAIRAPRGMGLLNRNQQV